MNPLLFEPGLLEHISKIYTTHIIIFLVWMLSLWIIWNIKERFIKNADIQGRFFMYFTILSALILICIWGDKIFGNDLQSNFLAELVGICITVFLVDSIYGYIKKKNEQLFRKITLRTCKNPIHAYFYLWLMVFKKNTRRPFEVIAQYQSLNDFLKSDDFYAGVMKFNFAERISPENTYAEYCNKNMMEIAGRFQNLLAKYGSKITATDVKLIEHFGGSAYMFSVFSVMDSFVRENVITQQAEGEEETVRGIQYINYLQKINRENFNKHFDKFILLVNEYNNSVEGEYQKWTLQSLLTLGTIESMNENPAIEW